MEWITKTLTRLGFEMYPPDGFHNITLYYVFSNMRIEFGQSFSNRFCEVYLDNKWVDADVFDYNYATGDKFRMHYDQAVACACLKHMGFEQAGNKFIAEDVRVSMDGCKMTIKVNTKVFLQGTVRECMNNIDWWDKGLLNRFTYKEEKERFRIFGKRADHWYIAALSNYYGGPHLIQNATWIPAEQHERFDIRHGCLYIGKYKWLPKINEWLPVACLRRLFNKRDFLRRPINANLDYFKFFDKVNYISLPID